MKIIGLLRYLIRNLASPPYVATEDAIDKIVKLVVKKKEFQSKNGDLLSNEQSLVVDQVIDDVMGG